MTQSARHLRRGHYRSMPWRNGAGVTLEIARDPPSGSEFLWRLSLATLAASGPFSSYPGYRRAVTLIDAAGFRLAFDGQEPVALDHIGATALFPGEASTSCALLSGPASDLSLMVHAQGRILPVVRIQGAGARVVPLQPGALKAMFCLSGGLRVADSDSPAMELDLHDTVLLGPQATAVSLAASSSGASDVLLLTWQT
jgi:environmental stress-induced protein Ves